MNYEEIKIETQQQTQKYIRIDNGDGLLTSFPAENSNPEYVAFLAKINGTPVTENIPFKTEASELETEAE
jgi:hypothetical protein